MSKLVWDKAGERLWETGVEKVVLYPAVAGAYPKGVAWNGCTNITEKPSGAEASPFYADGIKYANVMSAEEYAASITAYMYPDEFEACDGSAEIAPGVTVGQQTRSMFGLSFVTKIGNDVDGAAHGYAINLIYGALASPSEKAHDTVNDSPALSEFSWELSTTPVEVPGLKPTASLCIKSTKCDAAKMKELEDILYGTADAEARLPLPAEIAELFGGNIAG